MIEVDEEINNMLKYIVDNVIHELKKKLDGHIPEDKIIETQLKLHCEDKLDSLESLDLGH